MDETELRPQPGRQTEFLSSSADIVIYGGAAGGGKTWSLLIEPLRHISNGRFGAVIFRRSRPEITKEGGMWDETQDVYPMMGARQNQSDLHWTFPSGARVGFGHIQYDKDLEAWKSSQIALIEFDQLETFTEKMFFYMLSRNRSTCGVRPYIRASANPQPGWLADFLSWWIDDDGYANLDRAGVIRWFVREGKGIVWADSPDELQEKHPTLKPKSVTFIPATIYDNKILLDKDPGYLANLQALDYIDQQRLLGDPERGGNWKIKPTAGKVFNKAWFKIVPAAPSGGVTVRFWDFAATEKKIASDDPDYTASALERKVDGNIYILDITAEQIGPAEADRQFENLAAQDYARCKRENSTYKLRWEQEGGSAGKRDAARLAQIAAQYDAMGKPASGDKLTRAKPLAAQAYAGNVYLVEASWNEMYLDHMHAQPEWPHDDIMDASTGAYNELTSPADEIMDYYRRQAEEARRAAEVTNA